MSVDVEHWTNPKSNEFDCGHTNKAHSTQRQNKIGIFKRVEYIICPIVVYFVILTYMKMRLVRFRPLFYFPNRKRCARPYSARTSNIIKYAMSDVIFYGTGKFLTFYCHPLFLCARIFDIAVTIFTFYRHRHFFRGQEQYDKLRVINAHRFNFTSDVIERSGHHESSSSFFVS